MATTKKYHQSKDGLLRECTAQKRPCSLGIPDDEHEFLTEKQVQDRNEATLSKNYENFSTLSRKPNDNKKDSPENYERQLASIQTISDIQPIPGADKIELARVLGWNVVIGKGQLKPGDRVVYFEPDSFLPEDNPLFTDFQKWGQKEFLVNGETKRGHVLKTQKIRGVYSQGLIIKATDVEKAVGKLSENDDISAKLGVVKYEKPIPPQGDIIGGYDSRFAPKTDAIRVQTIAEHWDEIKQHKWTATVKVDGTSQTIANDHGKVRFFGHNTELKKDTATGYKVSENAGISEIVNQHPGMAVQFELVGPKVQSNRLGLSAPEPRIFAVYQDGRKLDRKDWDPQLLKHAVPELGKKWALSGSVDEMIEKVSKLRGNITKDRKDEGIVYHLAEDVDLPFLDRNREFKILNNSYLAKFGE